MPHNLCLQSLVIDVHHSGVDRIGGWIVAIKHPECSISDVLDRLVVVRCSVQFSAVVSACKCESAYHIRIGGHVDLNEASWCQDSVLVGDGERDEVFTDIVDESLWAVQLVPPLVLLLRVCKPGGKVAIPIRVTQFLVLALLVVLNVRPSLGEAFHLLG